ncbi:hypothetical protein NE237_021196 [Protea cynaroides]|uniref:Uncharacterized protein n=1 Tax=Protea cynaroides TaxID=273540 RepID=A0A9Q0H9T9_9MAGN|nr:hypothetical protein NE237_021196 [Protea cynaroides]
MKSLINNSTNFRDLNSTPRSKPQCYVLGPLLHIQVLGFHVNYVSDSISNKTANNREILLTTSKQIGIGYYGRLLHVMKTDKERHSYRQESIRSEHPWLDFDFSFEGDMFTEEQCDLVESAAEMLYGMIHNHHLLFKNIKLLGRNLLSQIGSKCDTTYCISMLDCVFSAKW